MELLAADDQGVRVLRLLGSFEYTDAPRFSALVEESIEAGHTRLVVDAEHMRLVCSAAFSALLQARSRLDELGGGLVIAALPPFASEIFRTLGLDRKITSFETVAEGVAFHDAAEG